MGKIILFSASLLLSSLCFALEITSTDIGIDGTEVTEEVTDLVEPESDSYDSSELLTRSIDGYTKCIKYCITKLEIRIIYYETGVEVIVAPVVAHNNPDMLVMATRSLGDEAYEEWGEATADIQKEIRQELLTTATGIAVEAFGGQTEFGQFGRHQSTSFLETEIMGNPTIVISQYYGRKPYDIVGHESGLPDAGEYGDLTSEYQAIYDAAINGIDQGAITDQALESFDSTGLTTQFQDISNQAEAISGEAAESVGYDGATFEQDSYICESEATMFYPYYLSSVDSIMWRSQYPFVDGLHTPQFFSTKNQIRPTGSTLLEDWGWIYPRTGFLNNDHSGRTAAVLSKRAAVVAGNAAVPLRLRIQTPHSHIYQKISPNPTDHCEANIADLDSAIDGNQAFSYNTWVRVECPTTSRGILVATIDIEDICIDDD